MDSDFELFHGPGCLRKGKNCTRDLIEELAVKYCTVEKECISTFVKIRTFIRLNYLNQQFNKKRVNSNKNKISKKMKRIVS